MIFNFKYHQEGLEGKVLHEAVAGRYTVAAILNSAV